MIIGSKKDVYNGYAIKTKEGYNINDLYLNKRGNIVSHYGGTDTDFSDLDQRLERLQEPDLEIIKDELILLKHNNLYDPRVCENLEIYAKIIYTFNDNIQIQCLMGKIKKDGIILDIYVYQYGNWFELYHLYDFQQIKYGKHSITVPNYTNYTKEYPFFGFCDKYKIMEDDEVFFESIYDDALEGENQIYWNPQRQPNIFVSKEIKPNYISKILQQNPDDVLTIRCLADKINEKGITFYYIEAKKPCAGLEVSLRFSKIKELDKYLKTKKIKYMRLPPFPSRFKLDNRRNKLDTYLQQIASIPFLHSYIWDWLLDN